MCFYATHTMVKLNLPSLCRGQLPLWAQQSLESCSYGVVTRQQPATPNAITTGLRSNTREKRCALNISSHCVIHSIQPEVLAVSKGWQVPICFEQEMVTALEQLSAAAEKAKFIWSPTGSIGFELATGFHST